jgi:glycosyltransferase involved in cell wall biosynthesis
LNLLLSVLVWSAFVVAAISAVLFTINIFLYRRPAIVSQDERFSVSVLIPARNEERTIERSVRAALQSRNVELEVIVLDDHSVDRTAAIVQQIARQDRRVRLESAPPLPAGWCGKQFACSVLAGLARNPILCFIDADVRVSPDGLARMACEMKTRDAALISGFPWQETHTALEQLLLPLMHFLLLGFLPIAGMRRSRSPAFGAGCGQIFVADRAAYILAGGHAAIKTSRHDGLTLPKAFRRAGFMTDLCDATPVASCRMYTNSKEVWQGLLKNATEGIASPSRIVPFSLLLVLGQVMPVVLFTYFWSKGVSPRLTLFSGLAVLLSYSSRLISVFRFRQPFLAALLHPVAILILLVIQWYAWARSMLGVPSTWKGRSYSTT